jgi:hypothetical protein
MNPLARRRLTFAVVLAAVGAGLASQARAEADADVVVVLLRPVPASDLLAETLVRIKSELLAGGFQVTVTDTPAALLVPDPQVLKQLASRAKPPSATLAIFGNLEQGKAELWVVDRITGKGLIRRVQVETSSDRPISEVLAIRVQELMRAALVEVFVDEKHPPTPAQPPRAAGPAEVRDDVAAPVMPAMPILPWRFAVEIGGSAFGGEGGLGITAAPVIRLRIAIDETFWLRAGALGLGTRSRLIADYASATVSQSVVVLDGAAWFRVRRRVRPGCFLGVGSERVAVEGSASLPYRGEQNARWYFAANAGIGLAVRLTARWEAQLEGHVLITAPRPTVRFLGVEVAQAGLPTLLAVLTVAGGG